METYLRCSEDVVQFLLFLLPFVYLLTFTVHTPNAFFFRLVFLLHNHLLHLFLFPYDVVRTLLTLDSYAGEPVFLQFFSELFAFIVYLSPRREFAVAVTVDWQRHSENISDRALLRRFRLRIIQTRSPAVFPPHRRREATVDVRVRCRLRRGVENPTTRTQPLRFLLLRGIRVCSDRFHRFEGNSVGSQRLKPVREPPELRYSARNLAGVQRQEFHLRLYLQRLLLLFHVLLQLENLRDGSLLRRLQLQPAYPLPLLPHPPHKATVDVSVHRRQRRSVELSAHRTNHLDLLLFLLHFLLLHITSAGNKLIHFLRLTLIINRPAFPILPSLVSTISGDVRSLSNKLIRPSTELGNSDWRKPRLRLPAADSLGGKWPAFENVNRPHL